MLGSWDAEASSAKAVSRTYGCRSRSANGRGSTRSSAAAFGLKPRKSRRRPRPFAREVQSPGALADRRSNRNTVLISFPRRIAKPGLGGKHSQFGVSQRLRPWSRLGGPARLAARYAQFEPAAQAQLVILDLGQQVIAEAITRWNDFLGVFGVERDTQPFRPRASISSGAAGISLLFSAPSDGRARFDRLAAAPTSCAPPCGR